MKQTVRTTDSIWNDRVRILQPKHGYRFGIDSVLLAHFMKMEPQEEALEIGTGTGVIVVLLSRLQKFKGIVAVEIQRELAEIAAKNFKRNGVTNAQVLEADMKELEKIVPLHSFDLVFSNPPYRKVGAGKLNPSAQKAIARHEIQMKLEDLFACAKSLLKPEGRLSVILPAFRENDFANLTHQHRFSWQEHQYVHSFANESPAFFLATVGRWGSSLVQHPPLVIYDSQGCYTTEMSRLLTESP